MEAEQTKTYTPTFTDNFIKTKEDLDDLPYDTWACYYIGQHAQYVGKALKAELHALFDHGHAVLVQEKLDDGVYAYLVKKLSTPLKVNKLPTETVGQINKALGYKSFTKLN